MVFLLEEALNATYSSFYDKKGAIFTLLLPINRTLKSRFDDKFKVLVKPSIIDNFGDSPSIKIGENLMPALVQAFGNKNEVVSFICPT